MLAFKTQMKDFKIAEPMQKTKEYGVRKAYEMSEVTETYGEYGSEMTLEREVRVKLSRIL